MKHLWVYPLTGLLLLSACKPKQKQTWLSEEPKATQANQAPAGALELVFPYGSEKEKWIKDVTESFNRSGRKLAGGKTIFVKAIPMGSGEAVDEILAGRLQAHIVSPASAAFVKLGNAESRSKFGKDLITPAGNVLLSPVVIAMWKPMAEAIGWGKKPVGWVDILALARNQKGWASFGFPQWGQFKFGHTHPLYSNSGLISLIAEVYAASGKTKGLEPSDLTKPHTGEFLNAIEDSVVHYGSSTGFFGRKMFENGPQYLSAAVLYESMVVESYTGKANLPFPVVAIYPKEGTFWSDHPIGIIQRDWVTKDHRDAADIYIRYLLDKPQQEKALQYGFRPAAVDVAVGAPIDQAHGVDPQEPKTTLEVPNAEMIHGIIDLWQERKKNAEVVLVIDTSGSMRDDSKLDNAKLGGRQLISLMNNNDVFSLLPFNNKFDWALQDASLKTSRDHANQQMDSLYPGGGTAFYDSVEAAYEHLLERPSEHRIQAIVALTDGEDNRSKLQLTELISKIRSDGENKNIRVFTIAYGSDAQKDILKQIADATQARSYEGTPGNIVSVFRDISTFF